MTTIERIQALKTRGAQHSNSRELLNQIKADYAFKREIGELYYEIFQKRVTGCNNCYADAFFELINLLKEEKGMETKIEKKFIIKRGVLLYDQVNLDAGKMMSYINQTTELALYHLATNPGCVKYFAQLPDNWQEQVEEYKRNLQPQSAANTETVSEVKPKKAATQRKSKKKEVE